MNSKAVNFLGKNLDDPLLDAIGLGVEGVARDEEDKEIKGTIAFNIMAL